MTSDVFLYVYNQTIGQLVFQLDDKRGSLCAFPQHYGARLLRILNLVAQFYYLCYDLALFTTSQSMPVTAFRNKRTSEEFSLIWDN